MRKTPMIAAIAITALLTGASVTYAASTVRTEEPMDSLVTAIATKFNLNEDEVQQVFEDQHAQMESMHQQKMADRLAQAVVDGTLTQEQAEIITAKQAELKSQREADKDTVASMTELERKTFMEGKRAEMEQWTADNNIPEKFMHPGFRSDTEGHQGHNGHGFGMHKKSFK